VRNAELVEVLDWQRGLKRSVCGHRPPAALWLEIARGLAANGHSGLLIALALGWLAAFTTVMRELREGFGAPTAVRPERSVPLPVRAALWVSGAGLAVLGTARLMLLR
jgi:hypothetical protein